MRAKDEDKAEGGEGGDVDQELEGLAAAQAHCFPCADVHAHLDSMTQEEPRL